MKRLTVAVLLMGLAVLCLATVAYAKGTVRVQQSDGSTQVYNDVTLHIVGQTLRITTQDGKGTLVITKAACSFEGDLMRCLPYELTLNQGGGDYSLDFKKGTLYLNLTATKQQLSASSTQVPPNGVLGLLLTKKGTIIAISGLIDGKTQ
jgi:hypothetical protein